MTHTKEDYAQGLALDGVHYAIVSDPKAVQASELRILGPHERAPAQRVLF